VEAAPGVTMIRLLPRLAMEFDTFSLTPIPIETMAITAPTPIIMPSMVRMDLSLLETNASMAILILSQNTLFILSRVPDNEPIPDVDYSFGMSGNIRLMSYQNNSTPMRVEGFKDFHNFIA
jgi:hypothetical protein